MKKWIGKHKVPAVILLIILLVILLSFAFVWSKLGKIKYDAQEDAEKGRWGTQDVVNVLLIGTDEHTDDFSEDARSDSMIIASLNKNDKTARLVSLERGMGVPVLDGAHEGEKDWLTHVFRYGGAHLLLRTVRECFDVDTDRYIRVNFNAVAEMVDTVGGVDLELTETEAAYVSTTQDENGNTYGQLSAGMNHLNGRQALGYARLREPDSDWRRMERQRTVIVQCLEKIRGFGPSELNDLSNELLPMVQTNLTRIEVAELLLTAPKFMKAPIEQMTLPEEGTFTSVTGMGGRSMFEVDFEENSRILHEFLYGEAKEEN